MIFYGYMCIYLWWPILYTYLHLVTYSVHAEYCDFVGNFFYLASFSSHILWLTGLWTSVYLFCKITSFLLITHNFVPIFYKYHFYDLVCTQETFVAFFVYFYPSWSYLYISYGDKCAYLWLPPLGDLFCAYENFWQLAHTSPFWPKFMT